MRPPAEAEIYAPEFPRGLEWLNVAFLRMNTLLGRGAVLVEFWDFARINSLRTLPYLKEWHSRYAEEGLRVIGVHTPGYSFGRDRDTVARAVERLEVPYAVALDPDYEVWRLYGNRGWPGRYLFDRTGKLALVHYGEGEYEDTEHAIGECLGHRGRADGAAPARGRAGRPARAADRGHRAVRRTAIGSSSCATGPTERTGSRRPTRARRPASPTPPVPPTRCCPSGGVEPGLYEVEGTVEAESPGLRLHGVQFTPVPPAPS